MEPENVLKVPNFIPKLKPIATEFGDFSGGNGAKQTQSSPNPKKGKQTEEPIEESSEEESGEDFFNISSIPQNKSVEKKKPHFTSSKKETPVQQPPPVTSVQGPTVKTSNEAYRKQALRPLPIFNGKAAKDWPAFINAYNYSTEKGPFDDEENTLRLRDYVTEGADLIEGFLISPWWEL